MNLSFVIPVFNEEGAIALVVNSIRSKFKDAEVIVVNDGSTDNTKEVLNSLNVKAVTHKERKGYTQAIKTGLKHATGEYVFCLDGDGQYMPEPVNIEPNVDIISGVKEKRLDSGLRIAVSKLSNFIARIFFNTSYGDMNSGYKIFHRNLIPLFNSVKYLTLSPWGEFIIRAHYLGYNIKTIKVKHYKRRHGHSKLMRNMLKVSITNGLGGAKLFFDTYVPLVKGIIVTSFNNILKRNYTRIVDRIYLGGEGHPYFQKQLDVRNLQSGFVYFNHKVIDYYVDRLNALGEDTLIFCKRGMTRSVIILLGYLVKYRNMKLDDALELVKKKRNYVFLGPYGMKSIRDYSKRIGGIR